MKDCSFIEGSLYGSPHNLVYLPSFVWSDTSPVSSTGLPHVIWEADILCWLVVDIYSEIGLNYDTDTLVPQSHIPNKPKVLHWLKIKTEALSQAPNHFYFTGSDELFKYKD